MSARIDMTGRRFGRWTVSHFAGNRRWHCQCNCGTEKAVDGGSLRSGKTLGCIKCSPSKGNQRTHGGRRSRLYTIWCAMKARCLNPKEASFARYGARGIRVCGEWISDFAAFRAWALANGYQEDLTIDRKNNDGHYEPANCRWATYAEQNRNYGRNRPLLFNGRYVLIPDLAAEYGLPQDIVKNRIRRYGWPIERALTEPVRPKKRHKQNIDAMKEAA
ncbi:hypothetical protein [Labrys neptuniae]|uniref:HNH endonuclease n=1 Tax=Labrys neptuniae TaxID=376174 RepID=A0ABV3PGU1_9HYPH